MSGGEFWSSHRERLLIQVWFEAATPVSIGLYWLTWWLLTTFILVFFFFPHCFYVFSLHSPTLRHLHFFLQPADPLPFYRKSFSLACLFLDAFCFACFACMVPRSSCYFISLILFLLFSGTTYWWIGMEYDLRSRRCLHSATWFWRHEGYEWMWFESCFWYLPVGPR